MLNSKRSPVEFSLNVCPQRCLGKGRVPRLPACMGMALGLGCPDKGLGRGIGSRGRPQWAPGSRGRRGAPTAENLYEINFLSKQHTN